MRGTKHEVSKKINSWEKSCSSELTTYGALPARDGTHLTLELPAGVPPPVELDEGLVALLLPDHETKG